MIQVENLSKKFDGFQALEGLNMSVPHGSIYGLVGPNGAGKSTAIRHITGIYRPDAGAIRVDGQPIYENREMKGRMAYIPDDVFFFQQAGIRDMMKFYRGIYPHFDENRYNRLRDIFQLDEKSPMRRLSKGMQKQGAFWLAISCRPDLLILDEPVDGLDPVMRRQIWNIILSDVAENGTTVLVSSHNLRELEDVCDRVGIINAGHMMLERSLAEMQENIVKIQLVLPEGAEIPPELQALHVSVQGRLKTLIARGSAEKITGILEQLQPIFMDILPLTLEEIFIYELGGANYAVKDIVL